MYNFFFLWLDRLGALSKLLVLSPSSLACPKEQSSINKVAGNLFSLLVSLPFSLPWSFLSCQLLPIDCFPSSLATFLTLALCLWPVSLFPDDSYAIRSSSCIADYPALPVVLLSLFFFSPPSKVTVLAVAASHRSYPPASFPQVPHQSFLISRGKKAGASEKRKRYSSLHDPLPALTGEPKPNRSSWSPFFSISDFVCRCFSRVLFG